MDKHPWVQGIDAAITVCDRTGIILEMNDRAIQSFASDGGAALIGTNVLDCHPEPARSKLSRLMLAAQTNVYTIQKHGVKKLIYQAPWYQDGEYCGFIEISFAIPAEMLHFDRDRPGVANNDPVESDRKG